MKTAQLGSQLLRRGVVFGVIFSCLALVAAPVMAATLQIQFSGMNLVYDGSTIYDAGGLAGGLGDPATADPLTSVDFFVDGVPSGSLSTDLSIDVSIPDVTGIPAGANVVYNLTTPGTTPGVFDLLVGTSPVAAEYILVDLAEVSVTYLDVMNIVQFTFGAAVGDIFSQNLPLGFEVGDPVTVSFSAQIVPGSRTDNGSFITGFNASGTGEISGAVVPEPATCLLAACGLAAAFVGRRRS